MPVAAGEFLMGAEDGDADERPSHRAYIDEFYLGVHPVTNAEYAQFVHDTGHPSPAVRALPLMVTDPLELEFRAMARPYCWASS